MRILLLILVSSSLLQAQLQLENGNKNSFYFYWGYNRAVFSKANIHFQGPNYDFTVYDLVAKDRPEKLGWVYFNPQTISIPQYNIRLGYFITNNFHVSFGMDHMKYVVQNDQMTRISGVISEEASTEFAGSYLNEPIQLTKDLLEFEHSDGFNLMSLDVEYLFPLFSLWEEKVKGSWNVGMGGIWIVTKTNVKVMGDGLDNDFHIAGFTLAGKTGPRFDFWNRFFLLAEVKYGYATLPWVLIKNSAPEIGDHNVSYFEYYIAGGVKFRLNKLFHKKHTP